MTEIDDQYDPYDGMTNADVMGADEIEEYDRAAEFAADAADDERHAAEDAAAAAAEYDDGEPWLGLADGEER